MNGELVDNNRSETYNFFFNTIINPTNRLNVLLTYRDLQTVGKEKSDETIMGRVDWNATFFDRIIQSDFSYNLSNSRELRREFILVRTVKHLKLFRPPMEMHLYAYGS